MREILFRGKRVDNGEWVYGSPMFQDEYAFIRFWSSEEFMCVERTVIPETVGQYTGLTDKNGTKIFEGDVITKLDGGMDGIPRKVVWDEYLMQFKCPLVRRHWAYEINSCGLWMMRDRDIEVIGNIHDNPELIGGEEDA